MMKKIFSRLALFSICAWLTFGSSHAAVPAGENGKASEMAGNDAPMIREGARVTLSGRLVSGIMAIGGETTGWQLKYSSGGHRRTIEVDVSALGEDVPEGKVRITGMVIKKNYVERGPTLILKAQKIVAR